MPENTELDIVLQNMNFGSPVMFPYEIENPDDRCMFTIYQLERKLEIFTGRIEKIADSRKTSPYDEMDDETAIGLVSTPDGFATHLVNESIKNILREYKSLQMHLSNLVEDGVENPYLPYKKDILKELRFVIDREKEIKYVPEERDTKTTDGKDNSESLDSPKQKNPGLFDTSEIEAIEKVHEYLAKKWNRSKGVSR